MASALGHGAANELGGLGDLVEHGGAQPRDGEGERDPLSELGSLLGSQAGEGRGERGAQGRDRGQVRGLGPECLDEYIGS